MQLTKSGLIRINFRDYSSGINKRLKCNFRCSYCNPKGRQRYSFTKHHFNQTKSIWDALATVKDQILVRINFDGETFIDNWAKRCSFYINKIPNVKVCEFITNNSVNPENYLSELNIAKTSFNCSFHPEHISIEKFIKHILFLKKSGCSVFATLVVTPQRVKKLATFYNIFKSKDICFRPALLLGPYLPWIWPRLYKFHDYALKFLENKIRYPKAYSKEALAIIRKYFYSDLEFEYQHGKQTKGLDCFAGVDMINVFIDGTVNRCFCERVGHVNDLVSGKVVLKDLPYACQMDNCECPTHLIGLKEFRKKYLLSDNFADHYLT